MLLFEVKEGDFYFLEEGERISKVSEEGVMTGKDETLNSELVSQIMFPLRSKSG